MLDKAANPSTPKRTLTGRVARLAIFAVVVLVAALAPLTAWPDVVHAQTVSGLIKNTGQTYEGFYVALNTGFPASAQAFTTGTTTGGYTLGSVGIRFDAITIDSSTASRITVTLNSDSSGSPGAVLCTLTDPATFAPPGGINNFTAPTTGPCPTLAANDTYHVVVERQPIAGDTTDLRWSVTTSDDEDAGGSAGWSIGNSFSQRSGTGVWTAYATHVFMMVVNPTGTANSNSAPAFSTDTATRTLPENSPVGTNVVGSVITATDTDGDTLTYSLTGTDAGLFEIDSSGQIKIGTGHRHAFNFRTAADQLQRHCKRERRQGLNRLRSRRHRRHDRGDHRPDGCQ